MMSPDKDLAAIEERLSRATPGPWWNESEIIHAPAWWDGAEPGAACHPAETAHRNGKDAHADAEFIAHAPADIAALLAEVKRLYAILGEVRDIARALDNRLEARTALDNLTKEFAGEGSP